MAKQQKPAIKNSFYSLYKDTINFILIILGIFVIATVISLFLIYMPIWMWYISLIIFAVVLILKFIKDNFLYVVYLLNQRRIPLLSTELQQLGINSVEEYANYTKKLLHGYAPREDIWRRVVINTYNCFFRNNELDEFVIARPDEYGFSSYDIFIKRKDYNLIQQTYQKGQKLDKDFLIKMNQEGINMHSNLFVSPTKYVTTSFGIPGTKNSINSVRFSFLSVFINLMLSIFSLGTNISTNFTPSFLVSIKIAVAAIMLPA